MQQAPPTLNPNLPGLTLRDTVVLSEKLHTVGSEAMNKCFRRCVTHYAEDSLPYHPGEKTCFDRCVWKFQDGFELAKTMRKQFEENARSGQPFAEWMKGQ